MSDGVTDDDAEPTVPLEAVGLDETLVIPWPTLLRRRLARHVRLDRRWAVIAVVLAGLFTVSCTITILVASLERVATDLGTTVSVANWSITGPMLAFGVVGPAVGKIGDTWGHKRVFLFGLALAGVFAVATALAWDAASMVGFRILSASAGAACGPAAMAYINHLFPPEERVRPLSYWSFVSAGAPVIGVIVGAPLVKSHGWRIIFWGQAPLCLAGVLLAWRLLPDTDRRPGVRLDLAGSATLGLGAVSLMGVVSQGKAWGWTSPLTLTALVVGVASLIAFVAIERRVAHPLIVLAWFRTRNFAVPVITQAFANLAYMGAFVLIPQLYERGMGVPGEDVATLMTARPIAFALIAPIGGMLAVRFGERVMAVGGGVILVVSMLLWWWVDVPGERLLAGVALALCGLALGASFPAMTSLATNSVEHHLVGVAGSMQQLMTQLGAVVGATVMTTVAAAGALGELGPFRVAFGVGAASALVATVLAAFVRPLPRTAA